MKWGPLFVLVLFAVPSLASAQVVINEVMYNPQGSDSGREWVELYNQGSADVILIGGTVKNSWRIGDSSNHTLTDPSGGTGRGSLTIPAGGYLIVASDPNEFISGEYAGGAYSVVKSSISLNNTGASVSLLDGTGAVADSVSYTNTQGANDDGSSLQRQADGSWIAALPTPGAANSVTPYVPPPVDTSQTSDQSTSTSDQSTQSKTTSASPSYVPPPTPDLFADAGGDRTAIVGADIEFDANAYDKNQTMLDPTTVRFSWNFGDGGTAEGAAVLHHFSYPGRYPVVLTIAQSKNAASDELVATAEPAALSFSLLSDGGVKITDFAGHDLDLSDWIVRADGTTFAAQFILPDHSEILSGSSMNISAQTLSFRASSSTVLQYPNGMPAFVMGEGVASSSTASVQPQKVPEVVEPVRAPKTNESFTEVSTSDDDVMQIDPIDSDTLAETTSTTTILQTATVSSAPASKYLWWIGVATLALAAGAAAIAVGQYKKREWDIVEDKSE